jgi:CRP-like cAMP-binding protein
VVHKYGPGDSFGESSLLFSKPRSSTVRCISESCLVHEMRGEDFMAVVDSSEGTAAALRNMCRKRLFKKAVKQFSLRKNRGLSDDDIVAAFHDADLDEVTSSAVYSIDDEADLLWFNLTYTLILSVWYAERGRGPPSDASNGS